MAGYSPCVVNRDRRIERRESRWSSVNFVGPCFPQMLASEDTVDGHPVAQLAEQPIYVTLQHEAASLVLRLLLPVPRQAWFLGMRESRRSGGAALFCQMVRCPSFQEAVASHPPEWCRWCRAPRSLVEYRWCQ
jgi:hypothetical protein